MKATKLKSALIGMLFLFTLSGCKSLATPIPQTLEYQSPLGNAEYVSTGATVILRYGPALSAQNLSDIKISVQGSQSGAHEGQTILADDEKTVIFKPNQAFTAGEQVRVEVNRLQVDRQTIYAPLSFSFFIATNQQPGEVASDTEPATTPPKSSFPDFLTLPQDIPHYTVSMTSPESAEGYIFVAPFYWTKSTLGSYLLIIDNQGQIVYYQSVADAQNAFDFKVQPNGRLSYFDQNESTFYLVDSHYQVVETYQAGNGYVADLHDLQVLPNGNALLMAYDDETVDMSQVVPDGKVDATVTGLIVQELDPSMNVIFEWRSWDHVSFLDSTANLTEQKVDLVHGNALALANDGDLLLSSRNLSEVTKIDLQTGEVIWRLGGKANMFEFINGEPFAFQHDIRQLPNGDLTIFDNQGTPQNPAASHAIEYRLDETNKTATQVWEFTHDPPIFATFMGDTQRLSNGNTFIDWGAPSTDKAFAYVTMTEVNPEDQVVFELTFDHPYVSYRAFRYPWQGFPDTKPALASQVDSSGITLGYSWNGATEVAAYQVLGGTSPEALTLIEQKTKTRFETQSLLTNPPPGECYFQVAALDQSGGEMARSEIISTDQAVCPLTQ